MSPLRRFLALASVLALGSAGAPPSSAVNPGIASPNVTFVATVPLDAPAISGRVITVGAQRRFYVTSVHGLTIYDVTDPALPTVLGAIANPHWENESAAVADDGSVVFLASDPQFSQPPVTYVIDTSLVTVPHLVSVILQGSHTATCSNAACDYLYLNYGYIYDVSDRANPIEVATWPGVIHYANRDDAGLLWANNQVIDPRTDPVHPTITTVGTGGWHGNLRPNAAAWTSRSGTSLPLHAGELVIGGDETWLSPGTCTDASGALSTWSIAGFDHGVTATKLDTIVPDNGTWNDGNPLVDPVGCSAHWFDYRDTMVANAWYDHGVRFIKVNEQNGALTLAGWWQPVVTDVWAAYWVNDEYVYTVDAVRGIDILRFDRTAPIPTPPAPLLLRRNRTETPWERREALVCHPRVS